MSLRTQSLVVGIFTVLVGLALALFASEGALGFSVLCLVTGVAYVGSVLLERRDAASVDDRSIAFE